MEFVEFDESDNEDAQVPLKLQTFHSHTKPFRFIDDLNRKASKQETCQSQPQANNSDESFEVDLQQIPPFKERLSLNIQTLPSDHIQTFDGKVISGTCPIQKPNWRKKMSIQKKRSSAYPLNGDGFTKLSDGRVIFGIWKNGNFHGKAKILYPSADIYIGDVKDYNRHGKGTLMLKNGDKYVGNFCNGKCEGFGIKYDQNGEVIGQGIWKNGFLVKRLS